MVSGGISAKHLTTTGLKGPKHMAKMKGCAAQAAPMAMANKGLSSCVPPLGGSLPGHIRVMVGTWEPHIRFN